MSVVSPTRSRTTAFAALGRRASWTSAGPGASPTVWLPGAVLTLVVGAIELSRPQLWRDEIASWAAATASPGQLVHLLRHTDAVSALYYACLHVWVAVFGDSVLALRVPSLIAMAAAAGLTAAVGCRVAGRRAGLLAGVLFAVVPAVSRFAQEARVYAFVVAAYALATLLLQRAVERPSRRRWAWYAVLLLLVGLCNLVAMAGVAGHAALVAVQERQRRRAAWRGFAAAVAVAVVCLVPLAVLALHQTGVQIGWIAPPTWKSARTFAPELFGSVPIAVAFGVLAVLAVGIGRRRAAGTVLAALLPVLLVLVVSLAGSTSYWFPRYLLFVLPPAAVVAALPLARLPLPAGLVVTLGIGALGLGPQRDLRAVEGHEQANLPYPSRQSQGFSYAAAARLIAHRSRPGDGYVAPSLVNPRQGTAGKDAWQLTNGMRYYLPRFSPPGRHLPEALVAEPGSRIGEFYPEFMTRPSPARVPQQRLWLLTVGRRADVLRLLPPVDARFVADHYRQAAVFHPAPQTTVVLFTRRGP